jgi:Cof subfamily protein (haloacid dehalogenase superfamily)
VVDIDGTLLNRSGTVSARDRQALAAASRAGITVALSTGRVIDATRAILNELSLDGYHVFFDGALVADPSSGGEAYVEPIDAGLLAEAVAFARGNGVIIELYSSTQYFIEREDWATDIRRRFFRLEPTVTGLDRVCREERVIKGTLPARTPDEKARADGFCRHFGGRLSFSWTRTPAYADVDFVNVIAAGASKGRALEELAAFLGIRLSETAGIGNGGNDISLLSRAGLALAMGDSPDEVKAVSDFVVPDVESSGVAEAVERFILPAAG